MPTRSLRTTIILPTLVIAALFAEAALAQITLVPGTSLGVAREPEFAALGDLDGDDTAEAVVLSPDDDALAVFSASLGGVLMRGISRSLGRRLSGVAVRDFDGDGDGDVLIADATGGAQDGDLLI